MLILKPLSIDRSRSIVQKNPICYFHSAYKFATRTLAVEVDSLVRVSRRVEKNHLAIVVDQPYYASSRIGETHSRSLQNLHPAYDALKTNRIPVSGKGPQRNTMDHRSKPIMKRDIIRSPETRWRLPTRSTADVQIKSLPLRYRYSP